MAILGRICNPVWEWQLQGLKVLTVGEAMRFDPERAAIRFGCGLSPTLPLLRSSDDMLETLSAPDKAAVDFPIADFTVILEGIRGVGKISKAKRNATTEDELEAADAQRRTLIRGLRKQASQWTANSLLRRALSTDALRERLTFFWADHFTAVGRGQAWSFAHLPYVESAIRPHVNGRFGDMLRGVATHPLMLAYLDQSRSVGPDSAAAGKTPHLSGLNENLAREMLELHTLGVDGPYGQDDVRELAALLTGFTYNAKRGFHYRPAFAQPGAETVLGVSYGAEKGRLADVLDALDDLSTHPATARHIARKLAVHFVSDRPDPALIDAMTQRFSETGGDLMQVYAAMLDHPAAWSRGVSNVKQPIDFIGSTLRALGIVPRHMPGNDLPRMRELFLTPLALMGQDWGQPLGPDGWPEADNEWITPQRLAARLQWGMTAPFRLKRTLPDPREFVETALGANAPDEVRFAARAAESRPEGLGIILASPAFQRM